MTIYVVFDKEEEDEMTRARLIEAPNQARALRYVSQRFGVTVAKPQDVAKLMGRGVTVENTKEQE